MIDFQNLTLKESSLFENYKSAGYEDFLIALQLADEKIINRILKTNGEWTKSRLTEIKNFIEDEINASYGGIFEAIQNESIGAAEVVYGATIGAVAPHLPKAAIKDLVNSKRNILGYEFKELFTITEENHIRQLKVILGSGVAQGITAQQIAREYGIKSNKLSKGQIKSNIFTVISHSRDEGRYSAYRELEKSGAIKGYIYDATLDSNTTIYCRDHDQKKYYKPINEIKHLIKIHFNCRSVFRPITESDTRASEVGEVKSESYEKWYLKQDKTFWKKTLTNKKYNAFLKDKYQVKGLVDLDKTVSLKTIEKQLI